jgi:subtilase family serine protease
MRYRARLLSAAGTLALSSWACLAGAAVLPAAGHLAVTTGASTGPAGLVLRPIVTSRPASATRPPTEAQCVRAYAAPCYRPAQLQTAYHERPLFARGITGRGQTIVIVDSFGSPTIRADLKTFDRRFHLPAPPSFRIIQPAGAVPPFDSGNSDMLGWASETTLDVQWAHSIAPGASILLVETPVSETVGTAGFPEIVRAENYVIDHHLGGVISQSFGTAERTFPSARSLRRLRSAYVNAFRRGVTVLAGSGDAGSTGYKNAAETRLFTKRTVAWPASDPLVTAVGGTRLQLTAAGRRTARDRVWNDTYNKALNQVFFGNPGPNALATGGGRSQVFARPWYQAGVAGIVHSRRGVPDIAMSGACSGTVLIYTSFAGEPAGWQPTCGTSEATPLFAGIVALAEQVAHHSLGLINPALYALAAAHAPGLVDITRGGNTVSFTQRHRFVTVPGFRARPGYDLASGVGTINAAWFVPELARAAGGG